MAAPVDAAWSNNSLSDSNLDSTTHGSGTSDPASFPTGRPFYRTDLNLWKYTSDGGTTWHFYGAPGGGSGTELNTTPVSDDTDSNTPNIREYAFFTLPSNANFYIITGIEWKNGATVGTDSIHCGVDIIDADPPVSTSTTLVAWGPPLVTSGASSVQRNSTITSTLIPGGSVLGAFINQSGSTDKIRREVNTGSSQNQRKDVSYTAVPAIADTTSWVSHDDPAYIKVYYKAVF